MDRELIFIVAFGIMGIAIFGGVYLGDAKHADGSEAVASSRPVYAPDDIRYKFQQEEAKQKKKKKHGAPSQPVESAGSDESGENSDASSDESPAEEPPIE